MDARISTHLHFDLHFAPTDIAAQLHVGLQRHQLLRHTPASLQRHRRENAALRHLPDDRVTHYVEDVQLPAVFVQHLLVTAASPLEGARLNTLIFSKIHIPRQARAELVERLLRAEHRNTSRPHPKLLAVGVNRTTKHDPESIIDVHDWVTAEDAAHSIISHHVELANLLGTVAAKVAHYIEYANGFSDLAGQILMQAKAHQQNPSEQNWAFETPYLDTNLQPTNRSYYNWSQTTKRWMRAPLQDSLNQTKNDPSLQSTTATPRDSTQPQNVGLYTVQQGIDRVSSTQPSRTTASGAPAARAADAAAYWTANDLTPQHGFTQIGDPSFTDDTFSITFNNSWLRWLSAYAEFRGADGNPVVPEGWSPLLPGNLAALYDSPTKKYVQIFSATNTILGIPVGNTDTTISFKWPANASSVSLLAGGLGRTGGIVGQDGTYVGSWDPQVCTPGAVYTGIFNLGIPALCMLIGAAVETSSLSNLAKASFTVIMDVAGAIISGPVSSSIQGGNTATLMTAFVDFIPRLLIDTPDLVQWLAVEFGAAAAEEATPIFGWIALAVSEATNLALLVQTSTEIALSPAVFDIDVSRAIDAQWTLLPDNGHQNTWPREATHYEIIATFKDGTSRTTTGQMTSSPQTGPITVHFDSAHKSRLPGGGQVRFTAHFYSTTGWLCGAAITDYMSAAIEGNLLTVPEMSITEVVVPLTPTTVYQFDRKLVYDAQSGARTWSTVGGAPTATVGSLNDSNVGNNLAKLVKITLSENNSEIGYTWQAAGQNIPLAGRGGTDSEQMLTFQSLDTGQTPDDRLSFGPFGFSAGPMLVFDLLGPKGSAGNNFWIDPRNSAYHVRRVPLGRAGSFDLAEGQSWGRFNQQMDAATLHPSGALVGVSKSNHRLEVLSLGSAAVADAQAPLANIYAGYGSRPGLLHSPVAVVANPTGASVVVLEEGDDNFNDGGARLQALDLSGNPVPIFAGRTSAVAPLRPESAAVTLLDLAIESKGYLYVLKYVGDGSQVADYLLDIYNPDGSWLAQTAGLSASKMIVDAWRAMYTLNFETLQKPDGGRTEPSVSIWLPSTNMA